ncbi:MAG TPA: CRTAC1 family protein [Candidatus Polarisedimenticolia bacterium]|nr:CRTAC1 family protein [Candidatus Polarisedimenticolia bacterium]
MTGSRDAALLACAALVLCSACDTRGSPPAAPPGAGPSAAGATAASAGQPIDAPFEDATSEAGLGFVHVNGATGQKYILETLGSGVCVFDYDGDSRQDVYFVQSGRLPGYTPKATLRSALYRNLGGGRFEEVTSKAGVGGPDRYGFGCVAGDIDGDGDRDLYVTYYGPNVLYRNNGDGTFSDVSERAGVGNGRWSTSASLADADADGDLDLYVAAYVEFDENNNLYCGENRPGWRTVCHPRNFDPQPDAFYRNRGDGTFEDATSAAGIADGTGKGLGVVWGDYDGDGDQDIYVANDDTPNFLWRNRGNGTFEEVAGLVGVALSEDGIPQAGMGTDMADYDNDGRLDLFVTNLSEETNELYHNDGNGLFSDRTFASGLGAPSLLDLGFGTFFFDMDQDGDQDVFVANGHIIDNIELYSDTITFQMKAALYRNLGDGRFDRLAYPEGAPLGRRHVARGAVPFDFDDDGDLDILMTQNNGPAVLLRHAGAPKRHWITVTLDGAAPNRDAVGAWVALEAGGVRQVRYARTASSYLSQGDRRLHFGLGSGTAIDAIVVRWPGRHGFTESFAPGPVDRFVTLEQGKGKRLPGRADDPPGSRPNRRTAP